MANLLVDGGADTLWKALKTKRRRPSAHFNSRVINDPVNRLGGHAGFYLAGHLVQNSDIDLAADPDPLDLLWCFEHTPPGHHMSLKGKARYPFIYCLVALFIFLTAATPAGIVSSNFVFLHICLLFLSFLYHYTIFKNTSRLFYCFFFSSAASRCICKNTRPYIIKDSSRKKPVTPISTLAQTVLISGNAMRIKVST